MRTVKGQVWLSDRVVIKWLNPRPTGRGNGRFNTLKGQATAVKRVYQLARSYKRIKRIYFYQWRQDRKARWVSAFTDSKGLSRPALAALRRGLHSSAGACAVRGPPLLSG